MKQPHELTKLLKSMAIIFAIFFIK